MMPHGADEAGFSLRVDAGFDSDAFGFRGCTDGSSFGVGATCDVVVVFVIKPLIAALRDSSPTRLSFSCSSGR